jgi:hypothetical protein
MAVVESNMLKKYVLLTYYLVVHKIDLFSQSLISSVSSFSLISTIFFLKKKKFKP